MEQVVQLAVSALHDHPKNANFFDDVTGDTYEQFKDSIQKQGVLTPLRVAPDMTVISGHQRLRACKDLGVETVPVIIAEDAKTEDEVEMQLIACNFGRIRNDPVKQGRMIKEYERLCGIHNGRPNKLGNNSRVKSQEEIAAELGIDPTTLRNLKRLAELPEEFQELITEGKLNATTGFKIISRLSPEDQRLLFSSLEEGQRYTAAMVQQKIEQLHANDVELEERLEKAERARQAAESLKAEAIKNAVLEREKTAEATKALSSKEQEVESLQAELHKFKFQRDELASQLESMKAAAKKKEEPKPEPVVTKLDTTPDIVPVEEEAIDSDELFKLSGSLSGIMTTISQLSREAQLHPVACMNASPEVKDNVLAAGRVIVDKVSKLMSMFQ